MDDDLDPGAEAAVRRLVEEAAEARTAAAELVGLTRAAAEARAAELGLVVRVTTPGNTIVTLEYRPNPVNLHVVDGVVTAANAG